MLHLSIDRFLVLMDKYYVANKLTFLCVAHCFFPVFCLSVFLTLHYYEVVYNVGAALSAVVHVV